MSVNILKDLQPGVNDILLSVLSYVLKEHKKDRKTKEITAVYRTSPIKTTMDVFSDSVDIKDNHVVSIQAANEKCSINLILGFSRFEDFSNWGVIDWESSVGVLGEILNQAIGEITVLPDFKEKYGVVFQGVPVYTQTSIGVKQNGIVESFSFMIEEKEVTFHCVFSLSMKEEKNIIDDIAA